MVTSRVRKQRTDENPKAGKRRVEGSVKKTKKDSRIDSYFPLVKKEEVQGLGVLSNGKRKTIKVDENEGVPVVPAPSRTGLRVIYDRRHEASPPCEISSAPVPEISPPDSPLSSHSVPLPPCDPTEDSTYPQPSFEVYHDSQAEEYYQLHKDEVDEEHKEEEKEEEDYFYLLDQKESAFSVVDDSELDAFLNKEPEGASLSLLDDEDPFSIFNEEAFSLEADDEDPLTLEAADDEPFSLEAADDEPFSVEAVDKEPFSVEAVDTQPLSVEAVDKEPLSVEADDKEPLSVEAVDTQPLPVEAAESSSVGGKKESFSVCGKKESMLVDKGDPLCEDSQGTE